MDAGAVDSMALANLNHDKPVRFVLGPETGGGGGAAKGLAYVGPDLTPGVRAASADGSIVLTGREFGAVTDAQVRDAAESYARQHLQGKTWVNRSTGIRVSLSKRGINKIINNSADVTRARLIPAIPLLVESGLPDGPEEPGKPDSHYEAYRRFMSAVTITGQNRPVKFLIGRDHGGHWYYNHETL